MFSSWLRTIFRKLRSGELITKIVSARTAKSDITHSQISRVLNSFRKTTLYPNIFLKNRINWSGWVLATESIGLARNHTQIGEWSTSYLRKTTSSFLHWLKFEMALSRDRCTFWNRSSRFGRIMKDWIASKVCICTSGQWSLTSKNLATSTSP